jgi:hypothetical protein
MTLLPPFVVKAWKNKPNASTPISAEALTDAESRLSAYAKELVELERTRAEEAEAGLAGGGGGGGITLSEADARYAPLVEKVNAATVTTGTVKVPDVHEATMNAYLLKASCAFELPAAAAGKSLTLLFTQDGSGSRVWSIPGVEWGEETAPVPSPAAGARDLVVVMCIDGTHWVGAYELNVG